MVLLFVILVLSLAFVLFIIFSCHCHKDYDDTLKKFVLEKYDGLIPNSLFLFSDDFTSAWAKQHFYIGLRIWWDKNTKLDYEHLVRLIQLKEIDLFQFIDLSKKIGKGDKQ